MKIFISVMMALVASSARANLGDSALIYSKSFSNCAPKITSYEDRLTILSEGAEEIRVRIDRAEDGKVSSFEETLTEALNGRELREPVQLAQACRRVSGTIENITVPAGNFKACKFRKAEGNWTHIHWFGAVPLGSIKTTSTFIYPNESDCFYRLESHLREFKFID